MAWTTPRTWAVGEVLSASLLNTHLRDNLNYLLSGRQYTQSTYTGSADATTSSGSFVDVDATNVIISITPKSSRARVMFFAFVSTTASTNGELDIYSNTAAARLGDATHGLCGIPLARNSLMVVHGIATGLTPGSPNSFKLQYRAVSSAASVTVAKNAVPIGMFAEEF